MVMRFRGMFRHVIPRRRELTPQLIRPFQHFFKKEASSSLLLIGAAVVALVWANSPWSSSYHSFWETKVSIGLGEYKIAKSLRKWIDEGLMALFFFIVGLEIKREVLVGELASLRKALLPVGAALGGMFVPAGIYLLLNHAGEGASGWGIPMATDIAFALGIIYMLGKRVPVGLRVFLSAFAIADDLGAVLVIALFYTKNIVIEYLILSAIVLGIIALCSYFWIRSTLFYAVAAICLWFFILGSGLHATVAGVLVAMFIPARGYYDTDKFVQEVKYYLSKFECPSSGCGYSILLNQEHLNAVQSIEMACHHVETPLQRLEHSLHPWVAYVIVPLFALANAGVTLTDIQLPEALLSPVALGIILGLSIGKPLGIGVFSFIAVKIGLARLPSGVNWGHIVGAGMVGGIGFTMSLFIGGLSFADKGVLDVAKLGILTASILSGISGATFLLFLSKRSSS